MNTSQQTITLLQQSCNVAGLTTQLIEPGENIPVSQLRILLETQLGGQDLVAEVHPFGESLVPATLQLFIGIPFPIEEEQIPSIARLLHLMNNNLPLHGFGMIEETREVFFRHLFPYQEGALDHQVFIDSFLVFDATMDLFGEIITGVGAGNLSFEDAVEKIAKVMEEE